MPTEIDLGRPPAGYSVTAARNQENIQIQSTEFTSTEDGQHFISRLEGFPSEILQKLSPPVDPARVWTLLAVCRRDGKATIYLNEEAPVLIRARAARAIAVGMSVTKNHFADVDRVELGVSVPDDAGVLLLFSCGWRRGLFYDFDPLFGPEPRSREYDLEAVLGQSYCHVMFQERFGITDDEWNALFDAKWFPFAALSHNSIDELLACVKAGWNPDEKCDAFILEIKGRVPELLSAWGRHSSFAPHIEVLGRACDRFQNADWISCTGLLCPRIEGILRTHHHGLGTGKVPNPANLAESAVAARIENEKCLLLPRRFATYLNEVYFASFNARADQIDVGRHSVAHGVASASDFNAKSALIGILVVQQLHYCLESQRGNSSQSSAFVADPITK